MHARIRYLREEKNMAAKRKRSCKWSLAEYIDKIVEKNQEILKTKQSNRITSSKKNAI